MDITYIIVFILGVHVGQEFKNFPNIKETYLYIYEKYVK